VGDAVHLAGIDRRPARVAVRMQDNHIDDPRARAFVAELRRFEQTSAVEDLTALFAEDGTASRLDGRGDRDDVATFWREHREQFDELSTTFVNATEGTDGFALEWTTKATLTNGHPISYGGVTVLAMDGDKIGALRTYYDTAAFLRPS
jgi:ketosteroid isomerase-like protein